MIMSGIGSLETLAVPLRSLGAVMAAGVAELLSLEDEEEEDLGLSPLPFEEGEEWEDSPIGSISGSMI